MATENFFSAALPALHPNQRRYGGFFLSIATEETALFPSLVNEYSPINYWRLRTRKNVVMVFKHITLYIIRRTPDRLPSSDLHSLSPRACSRRQKTYLRSRSIAFSCGLQ
ncbi:unnamed protein product [Cuscuta epithymum]|uniref:Uncharacterized protein n=1 Tax=Cuscuta epithymum TaxID=186058 RepID=A0AAV0CYE0_9ASTE|nr:unnamed protein product [Cuscuta epithymum]